MIITNLPFFPSRLNFMDDRLILEFGVFNCVSFFIFVLYLFFSVCFFFVSLDTMEKSRCC